MDFEKILNGVMADFYLWDIGIRRVGAGKARNEVD